MRLFQGAFDNSPVHPRPVAKSQSGQAAVETAIILPMLTFLVLGIIQLTMMQQAELMTEYAAYQACRAGIVWNGDVSKMEDAARVALAPTMAKSHLYPSGTLVHDGTQGLVDLAQNVATMAVTDKLASLAGMSIVRVDVIHPTKSEFNTAAAFGPVAGNKKELFFDDIGGANTGDGFYAHENYRKALLLTIRLRYLYELRIPFADWIIQTCFFAANAPNVVLSGQIGEESAGTGFFGHKSVVQSGNEETSAGLAAADAKAINAAGGKATLTKAEFLTLFGLRQVRGGIYLVPLSATYTMRMQSDLYFTSQFSSGRDNITN
jgi:Flp pilus assembly protein TadG